MKHGAVEKPDGIRVTDIERTVLDGLNDLDKIIGLEEFLRCLEMVDSVNEDKPLTCLEARGKRVLYQKTGYVLGFFANDLNPSDGFFKECAARIGKSTRHPKWNREEIHNRHWRLVAPPDLMKVTSKGFYHYDELFRGSDY